MSSKHARREIEPVVTGSILAAELTLDDARQEAFGAPAMDISDNTWWTGKPQAISIDRDKDGKPDALASIDYTIFGNLDSITVKNATTGKTEYTLKADRTFGYTNKLNADLDGDGKDEFSVKVDMGWWSKNVYKLRVDRDGDNKRDASMNAKHSWWSGKIHTLEWDKNDDGKTDTSFTVKRGSFSGYLSEVREKKE